ncbi:hypothetical protein N2152v2_001484 [Parachlorella kessleri]
MKTLPVQRPLTLGGSTIQNTARPGRRACLGPHAALQKDASAAPSRDSFSDDEALRAVSNVPDGGKALETTLAASSNSTSGLLQREALGSSSAAANPLAALLARIDFSEPISFDREEKTEYDPLRDGPLRYLGYANELGEAFAAWLFQGGVPLSYAVAISYVLFDTWDKYNKTRADAQQKLTARQDMPASVDKAKLISAIALERGVDTVVWQLIASVAAPGYTIHTIVAIVRELLGEGEKSEQATAAIFHSAALLGIPGDVFLENMNKSIPTAVGLLAIPFIVHPIDSGVHALLNATLRPALRRLICNEARGIEAGLRICQCSECRET